MPGFILQNEIITWLKDYPYWFQYAASQFLSGEQNSVKVGDNTYKLFLEDCGLKPKQSIQEEVIWPALKPKLDTADVPLRLNQVSDIKNVNALASNQAILISENLTIIYGGNGTGKSGYIRLLNNAFDGRGDKQILPNVFGSTDQPPSCKFVFESTSDPYELIYPTQKESREFTQYAVYDTACVRVHLEDENRLTFTPDGFDFFDRAVELYEYLKQRLSEDIGKQKIGNDFSAFFTHDNDIKQHIGSLGANSDVASLEKLGSYGPAELARLEELQKKQAELLALNIPRQIGDLRTLQHALISFTEKLQQIIKLLDDASLNNYQLLVREFNALKALSLQEDISILHVYDIEQIGSQEWREFVRSAKSYVDLIDKERQGTSYYPNEKDKCIYCLQPLRETERNLFADYKKLLTTEATRKLQQTNKKIIDCIKSLRGLPTVKFDESLTLYNYIESVSPGTGMHWKELVIKIEELRSSCILSLSQHTEKNLSTTSVSFETLNDLLKRIQVDIENLDQKNPQRELEAIQQELNFLQDKNLLNKLLPKIVEYISTWRWVASAEQCYSQLRTHQITIKQGELFAKHVSDLYTTTFNKECATLKAPKFVLINQRNVKGQTLRKLQVEGWRATQILSEGEQRAVCLADFLTEITLDKNNKGIILDDPVTSLDHERKQDIANRLVQESSARQVIIFTHDISFLIQLQLLAEEAGMKYTITTIRKVGDEVGIIRPELPWVAQKVSDRIKFLRNDIVRLRKLEKEGAVDDYTFAVKLWYGLLREAWERVVEERLFKGVLERFSPAVQTQKLKKVVISDALLKEIESGMTESSKWVHDQAANLNTPAPDSDKIAAHLDMLDQFTKKCVAP